MSIFVMSIFVMSIFVMSIFVMRIFVMRIFVMRIIVMRIIVMRIIDGCPPMTGPSDNRMAARGGMKSVAFFATREAASPVRTAAPPARETAGAGRGVHHPSGRSANVGRDRQRAWWHEYRRSNNWRSGPESNRHPRICSPLHHHSATGPPARAVYRAAVGTGSRAAAKSSWRRSALAWVSGHLYKAAHPTE
jgi:hypothetical protein